MKAIGSGSSVSSTSSSSASPFRRALNSVCVGGWRTRFHDWSASGSSASSTSRRCGGSGSRSWAWWSHRRRWSESKGAVYPLPPVYESFEAALSDPQGRRRAHHDAELPALPAGQGRARGRQTRRLREAARDGLGRVGRAHGRSPSRAASCTARTSASASTRRSRRPARGSWRRRSATRGTCTARTCRTGSCWRPTGTGGRAGPWRRPAPTWPTSGRTGSTSRSSSPGRRSSRSSPTSRRRSRRGSSRPPKCRRTRAPRASRPEPVAIKTEDIGSPAAALRGRHARLVRHADTFRELYRAVYAAVEAGGMPDEPDFPTFEDGHRAQVLGDAIAESHRERRWLTL